jgi:hypothetical protein
MELGSLSTGVQKSHPIFIRIGIFSYGFRVLENRFIKIARRLEFLAPGIQGTSRSTTRQDENGTGQYEEDYFLPHRLLLYPEVAFNR